MPSTQVCHLKPSVNRGKNKFMSNYFFPLMNNHHFVMQSKKIMAFWIEFITCIKILALVNKIE